MANTEEMTLEEREKTLGGIGSARKRKEDVRFIQGKGNYVDDIKLPGEVFGDFVRSPYAHARVTSIDTEAATAVPGVIAVLTADDLKPLNLHWMPTLAGDSQAVLADEKVHFQNQEVAFVIGEDRYAVSDGVQAVEVDYEELPVLVDPRKSLEDDAPILREDARDKTEVGPGPAPASQPYLHLGRRRQGGDRSGLCRCRGDGQGGDLLSAGPSLSARALGLRRVDGQGEGRADPLRHLPGAARDPYRGLADLRLAGAQDSRHLARYRRRLRQQGGCLSRLRLRRRRFHRTRPSG